MSTTRKSPVPNLQRGMAILEYLASNQCGASIAELTERLGYPSASVFRITQELCELGYLSRDGESKRFSLTNKFLLLGQPQGQTRGLVEAALPALRGLNRTTGETAQLCCLVETENVILEQFLSTFPFKYSAELGARCPAYSCAPGKAMMARLPVEDRDSLLKRIRFKKFTATTLTSVRALRDELEQIEACGYALDRAEGMEGIHCVAAAICDRNNYPVGAVTIAGPAARISEHDFARLGVLLIEAAQSATAQYTA